MARYAPLGRQVSPSTSSGVHPSAGPCVTWLLLGDRTTGEESVSRNSSALEKKVRNLPEPIA